jgi:hypothetical protein
MKFAGVKRFFNLDYCMIYMPYLHMYKPHFFDKNLPLKLECDLCTEYYVLLTTGPVTPVLYVVKLPVETASV